MLTSIKVNNCLIYSSEIDFSMRANNHFRRFPSNVSSVGKLKVLKTAILFGPNNSGKTNFVHIIFMIKSLMSGHNPNIKGNLFSGDPIVRLSVSFTDEKKEYLFEIMYDTNKEEYIYERFAQITHDKYNNIKYTNMLLRDIKNKIFESDNNELSAAMKVASRASILIYLLDTDSFPELKIIKDIIVRFASSIDIVDMNNIPIKKTIDMLKSSDDNHKRISDFVLNADLNLEDFKYLNDDEISIVLKPIDNEEKKPQENALAAAAPLTEMLHLASVYKGIIVPSMLFDSTGTKKMAALASYVIDALDKGRILVVDELDNSLHFRLTRAIISLFNNELNENAQLIATVHDISLLDCQTLFRKEQIWFTHKDKENAYLYSLADFKTDKTGIRDTTDLIDKYKKGVFGALPEPDLFLSLLEVKENAQTS